MQYDAYFDTAAPDLQTAYIAALIAIGLSPLILIFSIAFQLGWPGLEFRLRLQRSMLTIGFWCAICLVLALLDIPVVDYLIDYNLIKGGLVR